MPRPSRPAPAGVSASLAVKRRWGKPAVASGRELGLCVCPSLRPCGWEGPSPKGSGGGVLYAVAPPSILPRTPGLGAVVFPPLLLASWMVPSQLRVEAWSAATLSSNYWEEMLGVLSGVPAVGCGWCCARASAAVAGGGGAESSGAGNVEGANLPWSSLDVQLLWLHKAQLRIRRVVGK